MDGVDLEHDVLQLYSQQTQLVLRASRVSSGLYFRVLDRLRPLCCCVL
jgi:hypothetical protein